MTDEPPKINVRIDLADAEFERLFVVASDLEWLLALPRDRLLTHAEVRLAAGVLRRILIDDELGKLWATLDKPEDSHLTVEVPDLDAAIDQWPPGGVITAWAGGATTVGLKKGTFAHHAGFLFTRIPAKEWEPYGSPEAYFEAVGVPPSEPPKRRMTIREWMTSTSVAIHTESQVLVRISHESIVKYIANKKGGVHFDPKRMPPNTVGNPKDHRIQSALLDYGLLRVGHLTGPEFEVMSMVHTIAQSGWAEDTVAAMYEVVPKEWVSGNPFEIKVFTFQNEADGTGWATITQTPIKPQRQKSKKTSTSGKKPKRRKRGGRR